MAIPSRWEMVFKMGNVVIPSFQMVAALQTTLVLGLAFLGDGGFANNSCTWLGVLCTRWYLNGSSFPLALDINY